MSEKAGVLLKVDIRGPVADDRSLVLDSWCKSFLG